MRYFLTRREPALTRVLLIESGSRSLIEGLRPHLHNMWGEDVCIELLTCYPGTPAGFPPRTQVFRVTDYPSPESRRELLKLLRARNYSFAGMICSAEPVMTKWKWFVALRIPAKFFILNENGDFFWIHRDRVATIRHFMLVRAGLAGEGAIRTLARLCLFPFSVLFLVLYALAVHTRRALRTLTP